jgi:hypothetical protein
MAKATDITQDTHIIHFIADWKTIDQEFVSWATPVEVALKCGLLITDWDGRRRNAARKQWTTNRTELRLISRAKPTIVAINEDSGSIVSGEK